MSTREEVANILAVLSSYYPNFKLPEETVTAYTIMLEHYPTDILQAATFACVKTCKWFPTVAEISTEADKLLRPSLPAGGEAWGEAVRMMQWKGHSWEPKFSNPITQRCVDSLGWYYLCMSTNPVADRARFIELYDELARRHAVEQNTHPLVKQLTAKFRSPALSTPYYEQLPQTTTDPEEISAAFDRGEGEYGY